VSDSKGIDAASSGNGNVTVINGNAVSADLAAISATGNGTGTVTVTNNSNAISTSDDAIIASQAGSGNVLVTNNSTASATLGWGINASSTTGTLTVNNHEQVLGGSAGGGIMTSATTGATSVTNFAGAAISGPFGIVNTSTNGDITVLNNGSINGNSPIGISSTSSGSGNILITNNNVITGYDLGILGSSVSGNVTVNNNADLTSDVDGIRAQSTSGNVLVNNNASLITAPGTVISAVSSSGTSTVNINSGSNVTGGMIGVEIGGATATLNNNSSTIIGDVGVVAVSGTVNVNNFAGSGIGGNNGVAVSYRGTSTGLVSNLGAVIGAIQGFDTAGTVNLNNSGIWNIAGNQANLGGGGAIANAGVVNISAGGVQTGADVFTNNHIINVNTLGGTPAVLGAMAFNNNGAIFINGRLDVNGNTSFANAGDVNMFDGVTDDRMDVSGNRSSEGGRLMVDIDLSQFTSPTALSDKLNIDGTAMTGLGGPTTVFFDRVSPDSNGLVLPDIPIVMTGGAVDPGAFTGSLGSSGLVDYTFLNSGDDWVVRSSFDPIKAGSALTTLTTSLAAITLAAHQPQPTFYTGPFQPHPGQQDYGLWGRINAGYTDVDHGGSINTFAGKNRLMAKIESDFTTFIGGMDLIGSQVDGWDYVLGVMGGLLRADTYNMGAGGGYHLEAPFVGGYFTASNGAWTIEGNGRYDWYDLDLSNPGLQLTNRDVDGNGVNANVKVAYNGEFNGIMVSPNIGVNYTRISLDDFWANNNTAKVSYGYLESLIGSIGIKFAGEAYIPDQALVVKPFLELAYMAELDSSADTSYMQFDRFGNPAAGFTANYNTVGDFFKVSTGIAGVKVDENVTGYVAVDYSTGDDVESLAVNGGLRKVF